jgi:cation:H+ antiporter
MLNLSAWPLWANVITFLVAAGIIAWAGTKLAAFGDRLADRTGLGEAITGMMFLGFTTALPGLAASITAALDGRPALAISNAIGGIAIQTAFLAVADIAYTKANLEHASASVTNMIQTAMLVMLLALVLLGLTGPDVTIAHVHPMTPALFLAAGSGFWLVYRSSTEPMWKPEQTAETIEDIPEESYRRENLGKLLVGFGITAGIVTVAGAVVAYTTGNIADATGFSETVAGGLFSGVATSLPELVTTIAAVRRRALTLAVSDIVGGNFFDVLFVFAADLVYLQGSLYHAKGVGVREVFLTGLAILLNITLLLGLLYRQRGGPANIGFESVLMLLLYIGGFLTLSLLM